MSNSLGSTPSSAPTSASSSSSSSSSNSSSSTTTSIDPRLDFFAGTIAGVASLLTGQPFDTIKVRLQCQDGKNKTYRNSVDGFFKIVREEKLGVAAINACVFSSYGLSQRLLTPLLSPATSSTSRPSLSIIFLSGSLSGLLTSFITTPIERLKILQQSAPSHLSEPSLFSLIRSNRFKSLYRGWGATCLRDLGYGPYFFVYEFMIRSGGYRDGGAVGMLGEGKVEELEEEVREVGTARVLLAGALAGIAGWGSTFAMDVIKTRIQSTAPFLPSRTNPSVLIPHPYRTITSAIQNSYRSEGAKVFFVGLGPTLLRSIPVNMVCFFVFEAVVSAFR